MDIDFEVPDTPAELIDQNGEVIPGKPIALFGISAGDNLPLAVEDFLQLNQIPYKIQMVSIANYFAYFCAEYAHTDIASALECLTAVYYGL